MNIFARSWMLSPLPPSGICTSHNPSELDDGTNSSVCQHSLQSDRCTCWYYKNHTDCQSLTLSSKYVDLCTFCKKNHRIGRDKCIGKKRNWLLNTMWLNLRVWKQEVEFDININPNPWLPSIGITTRNRLRIPALTWFLILTRMPVVQHDMSRITFVIPALVFVLRE